MTDIQGPRNAGVVRLAVVSVLFALSYIITLIYYGFAGAILVSRFPGLAFTYTNRTTTYLVLAIILGAACKVIQSDRTSPTVSKVGWLLYLGFLWLFAGLYRTASNPEQVFLEHLYSVTLGDTTSEVQRKMAEYGDASLEPTVRDPNSPWVRLPMSRYRATASGNGKGKTRDPAPDYSGIIVFGFSEEAQYNAAGGAVEFVGGRVVHVRSYTD